MNKTDQTILSTLLRTHAPLNFRTLQRHTRISPRILRKHLDTLKTKNFISEQGRSRWKKGKPLFYRLTLKGQQYLIDMSLENVACSLKYLADLTHLAHNSRMVQALRQALQQPLLSQKEIKTRQLPEILKIFEEREAQTHGVLREALKAIYNIFLEVELLPHERLKGGFVMGITKEGGVHLIPVALLKQHGLGVG